MNIVLDTNVLISGIFWGGPPFRILEHWISDDIEIIVTPDILNEYVRVIECVGKKQPELMSRWINLITIHSKNVEKQTALTVCRNPDDDKFLECAVSGKAACIVSGDDDLLALKSIHAIPILKPSVFILKYFAAAR